MIKYLKKLKDEEGFTLVEMAIVLLIIAALLLIIIPNIGGVTETAGDTANDAMVQTVETQKIIYEAETGERISAQDLLTAELITQEQFDAYTNAGN